MRCDDSNEALPSGGVRPDYMGYCLSNVPSMVFRLFGISSDRPVMPDEALGNVDPSGVDNVVLFLMDGLGYNEWTRQGATGLIGDMCSKGCVRPITTVFPSTTAAALTTVSTGLTTQEHGLVEWYVYFEEVDSVVQTLPFAKVGNPYRDSLKGELEPRALFDGQPIFVKLRERGVKCTSFVGRAISRSVYSQASHRGSEIVPYFGASDMSVLLRKSVEGARGKNLFYVYWNTLDSVQHSKGPGSDESEVEALMISLALQRGFLANLEKGAAKRTLLIVTADHGHMRVAPESTIYLNKFRRLMSQLKQGPSGRRIPPWGSARDVFVSVEDSRLEETQRYLQKKLEGKAKVIKTSDAVSEGLFGLNSPSRKFLRRVGNLMILPDDSKMVWYKYRQEDLLELRGHHGGLSGEEMIIPLAIAKASDLQTRPG